MMMLSLLGPMIAAALYVVIFQKAGFSGPILAVCAAPLLGALVSRVLFGMGYYGSGLMVGASLVGLTLSLLPLLILAFKAWPPVAPAAPVSTEKV